MWEHIVGPESQKQILDALIIMIKTGGFYAILGVMIYYVTPLLSTSIISITVYKIIHFLTTKISNIYLLRRFNKDKQVSLLSKQVSKHLEDAIADWRKQSDLSCSQLLEAVAKLQKDSLKTSEKTEKAETA